LSAGVKIDHIAPLAQVFFFLALYLRSGIISGILGRKWRFRPMFVTIPANYFSAGLPLQTPGNQSPQNAKNKGRGWGWISEAPDNVTATLDGFFADSECCQS
jgi:hypothetical protein